MASTSGIFDVTTGGKVALGILNMLLSATTTAMSPTPITGPIVMRLYTAVHTDNATIGTPCPDANYSSAIVTQGAVTWNTAAQTLGQGSAAGYESKTNSVANTYFGSTGAAAAQTIVAVGFFSQDSTPIAVMYENIIPTIAVPQGNQLSFPITTGIKNQIG